MRWIEGLSRDVRHACRLLARRPLFALVGIATLGIGLASTTVAFTGINALFIRGADGTDVPGAGWILFSADNPDLAGLASFREYEAFSRDVPSLDVSAQSRAPLSYRGPDGAETLWSLVVSPNYFELLDVEPAQGRLFSDLPTGAPAVVVSTRFWRDRLDSAPLAGLTVSLNGLRIPVAGVLPEGHRGPGGFFDPSVWLRLSDWEALGAPPRIRDPRTRPLALTARLRGGATRATAERELDAVVRDLAESWPDTNRGRTASLVLFEEGHPELNQLGPVAGTAMLLVGLVLGVAVFNFAGLLLARAVDREREMTIRAAVGASRAQIVRQLVVESLVVAALGGGLALIAAQWSSVLLGTFAVSAPIPQRLDLTPDRNVVGFAAAAFLVCGAIAGLFPAYRATRLGAGAAMNQTAMPGTSRASRLRTAVVGLQLAGATVLLTTAAAFVQSAIGARSVDVGFDTDHVLLVELAPAMHGHTVEGARRVFMELGERLRSTPGVRDVSVTDRIPFYVGVPERVEFAVDGRSCAIEECPRAGSYRAGPGYFRALDIPIRRGREFDGRGADDEAVVISETMARQLASPGDVIGRRIAFGSEGRRMEVIGVAADVLHRTLRDQPTPYVYFPLDDRMFEGNATLVARTDGDPRTLTATAREQLRAIAPDLPPASIQTMAQRLDDRARRNEVTVSKFFLSLGGLAVFLAAVGLTGTVAYSTGQRTREFGVRAALGATPSDLRRLVFRDGFGLAMPGVAFGLLGAFVLLRIIGSVLRGVDLSTPVPYLVIGVFQVLLTLAASAVPGRRAARASPLVALRAE